MLYLTKNIYRSLSNVDLGKDQSVPVSEAIKEVVYKCTAEVELPMMSHDDIDRLNNLKAKCYHWITHPFRKVQTRVSSVIGQEEEDQEEEEEEEEKE